jgi:mannosylglycerate hydrolase
MAGSPIVLHVVSHIRWKREGILPFQKLRLRLVSLIDSLIEASDSRPEHSFMLDGQAVTLDDYLEVRPEQRTVISRLLQTGQLYAGPWYVTPDEFLVSPEALIRDLLQGMRSTSQLGPYMDISYMPDSSGHIGQLPQILRGFGIRGAVLIQGLGEAPAELWWEAPDGSRMLVSYLRDSSDTNPLPSEPEELKGWLAQLKAKVKEHSTSGAMLLMHEDSCQSAPLPLQDAAKRLRGIHVIPSNLPSYFEYLLASGIDLPVIVGELRSPQRFALHSGTLSTHIEIKQRNHEIQTLLERWCEPFSAWVHLLNEKVSPPLQPAPLRAQTELIAYAWRLLLQNHSPASIRGCSIGQVYREVDLRFDQTEQIAETLTSQNLEYIAGQIATDDLSDDPQSMSIVVFNAAGHSQTGIVSFQLPDPTGFEVAEVIDERGQVQPLELETQAGNLENPQAPSALTLRFVADNVPPFGYRVYVLRPAQSSLPAPQTTEMDEGTIIENEYLNVEVDPTDGTLSLFDKRTGRSFSGLNRYIDGGDSGDCYTYCPPVHDTQINIATNTPLHVERRRGPVTETLYLFQIYRLPQTLTPDRRARLPLAAQFVPISILTAFRLYRGVPRLDVEVTVTNSASDHRLRVHFPTGIVTQEALFDGHFEVVRRPLALPNAEETRDWAEQPALEQPQRAFVTVLGDETGLTLANRGLPEVAILAGNDGAEIALTLLRCIGWLSREDLINRRGNAGPSIETPEAQCWGEHRFAYSLIPHGQDPWPAWQQAWAFQTPLRAVAIRGSHSGPLPPAGSLVSVDNPAFVVSTVKMASNGRELIVRGYNISEATEKVSLRLDIPFTSAQRVRLDESPIGEQVTQNKAGLYTFKVRPNEVVTLAFS